MFFGPHIQALVSPSGQLILRTEPHPLLEYLTIHVTNADGAIVSGIVDWVGDG